MLRRFLRARDGNLSIIFAFSAIPVLFALGATCDYGYAVKVRARLNAAADAASLAGVTPSVMQSTTDFAKIAATQMFNTQVVGLPRLNYDASTLAITATDATVANKRVRTVTVTYKASVSTVFSALLHMNAIPINGTSTATASTSPNIDFYLMLDTSPSMAIPSTQDGINQMVALTPYQDSGGGCAFACHEASPAKESGSATPSNPIFGNKGCPDDPKRRGGGCQDNYALAIKAGIPLRIQLVNQAVQNLVDTAQSTALSSGAVYQLAGYTFDVAVANPIPLQLPTNNTKTQAANGINMLVVDSENSNNGDQNTVFDTTTTTPTSSASNFASTSAGAFPYVYNAMTKAYNNAGAGNGTNASGDHPQQVMMLVTDGVSDQPWTSGRIYKPIGGMTNTSSDINDWCTKIKSNTNVRIAVLYLVYNPLPMKNGAGGASWYAGNVYPIQNDIAPTLQNCASTPNLFYQVNTGGDISAAMSNLFQQAVTTARLSN